MGRKQGFVPAIAKISASTPCECEQRIHSGFDLKQKTFLFATWKTVEPAPSK